MDFDYRLLAKYLTGMLSPEEMKQVEEWRELSIDNEEAFSKLMKLRVSWKFTQYNTPEHIEKALNGLNARINSRRQFQIFCSVMRYAAVIFSSGVLRTDHGIARPSELPGLYIP